MSEVDISISLAPPTTATTAPYRRRENYLRAHRTAHARDLWVDATYGHLGLSLGHLNFHAKTAF